MRCKVVRLADLRGFKLCSNCAMLFESVLTQIGGISVRGFPSNITVLVTFSLIKTDEKYNTVHGNAFALTKNRYKLHLDA